MPDSLLEENSEARKRFSADPGVCMAGLGVVAFVYMLVPGAYQTPLSRAFWILAISCLGVAEIMAIYRTNARERKLSDERFGMMMNHFQNVQKSAVAVQRSMTRLTLIANDPVESLRKRASHISETIL
jgi:hypothetical protein